MPTQKKLPSNFKKQHDQFSKVLNASTIRSFRRLIFAHYAKFGRQLPFRSTRDPYAITVSEFMLQQTQVARVLPKYETWLSAFPDWESLASASKVQVLRAWSGLGYNRRALYLHELARKVVNDFESILPENESALVGLAGLGPYTRRAILIFAHNANLATVDTNIRRILIAYFKLPESLTAGELQRIAERIVPKGRSREWHYALMDYGALTMTVRVAKIRPRTRQSVFEGSVRQVRGAIVRKLASGRAASISSLSTQTGFLQEQIEQALTALVRDGIIERRSTRYRIKE